MKLLEAFDAVLDKSDVFIIGDRGRKVSLLTLVGSVYEGVRGRGLELDF